MSRYLAAGAAIWAAVYACGCVALVHQQGDSSAASWYVVLVLGGAAAMLASVAGDWGRLALIVGLVLLVFAALTAASSIGLFLLPAVGAAGVAIVGDRPVRAQT